MYEMTDLACFLNCVCIEQQHSNNPYFHEKNNKARNI